MRFPYRNKVKNLDPKFVRYSALVFLFIFLTSTLSACLAEVQSEAQMSEILQEIEEKNKGVYLNQQIEESTTLESRIPKVSRPQQGEKTSVDESKNDSDNTKDQKNSENKEDWPSVEEIYQFFQDEMNRPLGVRPDRLVHYLDEQMVAAWKGDRLLRLFPASSGFFNGHTPLGVHALGMKYETSWLFDGALAQYGFQISGNILFHSLPSYDGSLNSGLKISDLNAMGQAASHGCVRLFCIDAKWIYDHCDSGLTVEVVQRRRAHEQHLPASVYYIRLKDGAPKWDPSDPDPNNPYHDLEVLKRWAVERPWENPFQVVPPVWPGSPDGEFHPEDYEEGEVLPTIEPVEYDEITETVENSVDETVEDTIEDSNLEESESTQEESEWTEESYPVSTNTYFTKDELPYTNTSEEQKYTPTFKQETNYGQVENGQTNPVFERPSEMPTLPSQNTNDVWH